MKRINRIFLLVRCFVRSIMSGRSDKIPSNPRRIIIVPTGKLGDVVCNTPVLHAIRKHLPEVEIVVGGNSKLHRPLLSDSGLVDEYLDLEEGDALARIRNCRADVAIVTGPSFQHAALFYLAGIPLVIAPIPVEGVSEDMTRPYKIIQRLIKTFPHRVGAYAPLERLRSLEPIGIFTKDTRKYVGFSKMAEKKAVDLIDQIPHSYKYLIGISAGAGGKEKQWPPEKFAQVANYLIREHNTHIIVFGGTNNISESTEMISAIEDRSRMTDSTCVSIDDLKARISKLDAFISVNTGPIYIAEAFDIPTVDILGPVNPWDQPPQGKIHKMVFPSGNPKPLISYMNVRNHDVKEAHQIAESTRVEDVISAIKEVLREVDERATPGL